MSFIDVGYLNFINADRIVNISIPDSSPIKRLVSEAKKEGRFIDLTQGRKTRAIIYSQCGDKIILSAVAVQTSTIVQRIKRAYDKAYYSKDFLHVGESET